MREVSQTKVDVFKAVLEQHVPGYQIVYKDEEMPTWWLKVLIWFFDSFIRVFSDDFADNWMNNFANGLWSYLLLPSREGYSNHRKVSVYGLIRHEAVHMRDMMKHPVWFPFSYLFVLPTLFTMRAFWEYRGYTQQMLVEYELTGDVSDSTIDWLEGTFSGSTYLWMDAVGDRARKRLESIRERILSGETEGFYPEV